MLVLIIHLCSHYVLVSCADYEKAKFDEFLFMNKHHQNLAQIKDFIKEARHKFHEERSVLRVGDNEHESTRDDELLDDNITQRWWDNTSSTDQLGLNTPQTFLLPVIRPRPLFPISITPYTTESNKRHLNWDIIFPAQSIYRPSDLGLRTGQHIAISTKTPSLSKAPRPKERKTFPPPIQPPKLDIYFTPFRPNRTRRPTFVGAHGFIPNTTLITPNEEFKKIWLQEITTYSPLERWVETLATQIGMTSSYDYLTPAEGASPLSRISSKASKTQALVLTKQLKNESKDQTPRFLRQGLAVSDTLTEVEDYWNLTASTAKPAQVFIKDVGGILDLRTVSEKDDARTKNIDEKTANLLNAGQMKVTLTTAADVLHIEQKPETPTPSSRKSRRFHSNPRKGKRHHDSRYKRRQIYQKHTYRHPDYSNEHIYRRQKHRIEGIKTVRRSKNRRHREPTEPPNELLQYSEQDDTEDENLIKFIERKDESVRNTAQKDKTAFYHQVKESLKRAESRKKAKRLKLKAELLRKIVEGSSYSDEEASLTKNLIQALQYGNVNTGT